MDLSQFHWHVDRNGYEFADLEGGADLYGGDAETRRYLIGKWEPGKPGALRSYWLQEMRPDLFQEFAHLAPEEGAILAFAGKWGRLGVSHLVNVAALRRGRLAALRASSTYRGNRAALLEMQLDLVDRTEGEDLEFWKQEIHGMGRAAGVWEALLVGDSEGAGRQVPEEFQERAFTIGADAAGWYEATPRGVAVVRAWAFVQAAINERLQNHCRPQLVYSEEVGRFRTAILPKHLLGAMWAQFALAVEGGAPWRRCDGPGCTRWFIVQDSRKTFCSDRCRMRRRRAPKENGGEE